MSLVRPAGTSHANRISPSERRGAALASRSSLLTARGKGRPQKGDAPMRLFIPAAALAALALAATPANAQNDEIVVTATRRPTQADRLPARVDVISRADIETRALASLPDALGAQAVRAGGAGQQTSLFLRGANSKHALALFDGIRLNDAATPNSQYDFGLDTLGGLERIEIVRGPASSIYGSDAIGGVVNLIPRRGGDAPFAPFAEASAGSFGSFRALAGVAGTTARTEYGASAEWFATEGYDLVPARMATHTGDPDGAEIATLTASARHHGDGVAWDALARLRRSTTAFDSFSGGPFFDLRADDPNLENEATQSLWRLAAEATIASADVRFSGGQVLSDRAELDNGVETSAARSRRDFLDLTAAFDSDALQVTAGLAFERNAIDTRPLFADSLFVAETQYAAFAVAQFDLAPRWIATTSLRLDRYENFGTQTTYGAGLVWSGARARAYVSTATAFKAPSLSERFETSFFTIANPDLAPEQVRSWEVGADWRARDDVKLGVSFYSTRIDNLIEYAFAQSRNLNVGEAEIDGAEFYLDAKPARWAQVRLAYVWTDARNGLTGAPLPRRPEQAWRLDARLQASERLALALAWTYVGDRADVTYGGAGNFLSASGQVKAYDLGALTASYQFNSANSVFIRVDNLTDRSYEQPAAFAAPPRAWQIGLRSEF
jgi:vitamin B12 transporter